MIYCSGCIGMLRETKALISDDVGDQTRCALENMRYILEAAGSSMSKVVKCTVLLVDMGHFAGVNAIYSEFFPPEGKPPARACYAVAALPAGCKIEIDCICIE
jgi:2-iminobutanoate/2-iminopropanoate deaminase